MGATARLFLLAPNIGYDKNQAADQYIENPVFGEYAHNQKYQDNGSNEQEQEILPHDSTPYKNGLQGQYNTRISIFRTSAAGK